MVQPPSSSSPPPSLGSNNPFRRKASAPAPAPSPPGPSGTVPAASPAPQLPTTSPEVVAVLPTGDEFWNQLQGELSRPSRPPPSTSFQKPKVVKRVRVQSPPPSPPESAGRPRVESESDDDSDSDSVESAERLDPFTGTPVLASGGLTEREEDILPVSTSRIPENPFQHTSGDLKGPSTQGSSTAGSTATKGNLDVGAFGRLLLTGQTSGASATIPLPRPPPPQASQDTPRTSHEISEQEVEDHHQPLISRSATLQPAPNILRKKPPPPSSRHGKLIRPESSQPSPPTRSLSSPTPRDINKPLPSKPFSDDDNIFDHSAAGKVPEPRPPTPPQPSSNSNSSSRKPAPPPRRQPHRPPSISAGPATPNLDHDLESSSTRRSSIDSVRSRSSSLRVSVHAPPAPPPPRRLAHARGLSNSVSSPQPVASPGVDGSLDSGILSTPAGVVSTPPQISGAGTPDSIGTGASSTVNLNYLNSKLSPPPPPPARNTSVRSGAGKRPSASGNPAGEKKTSRGSLKSPPPPVPRHRGELGRTASVGSVHSQEQKVDGAEVVGSLGNGQAVGGDDGGQSPSADILADLTRLQREVDELRAGLVVGSVLDGNTERGRGVS